MATEMQLSMNRNSVEDGFSSCSFWKDELILSKGSGDPNFNQQTGNLTIPGEENIQILKICLHSDRRRFVVNIYLPDSVVSSGNILLVGEYFFSFEDPPLMINDMTITFRPEGRVDISTENFKIKISE
jgi:hypothetical protein